MEYSELYVTKRNGNLEKVSFDKILTRIKQLCSMEPVLNHVNYTELAIKIIDQIYDRISTKELDELTAQQCASQTTDHLNFGKLASRIVISNHHKNTSGNFADVTRQLYEFKDVHGIQVPIVNETYYNTVMKHSERLTQMVDYSRDYLIDYFGFKTLERAYLMKVNGVIIERPQDMWLRVAVAIHNEDMVAVEETYNLMSQKYFTHATPTLFNAGTPRQQMSSCYLLAMENDSIKGIYNTLSDCAMISKWAGGIGLHIHNIRATGSHIRGTNGTSNGIVPMLRVFNNTARYVDQGGGRRNGSFAMYLEPWHADIENFLQMRKNHGDEEMKARDLFYALWIPDLFMKRVKANGKWTLMCPDKCPGLSDVYGDEFEELYTRYEKENKGNKTMNARDLWFQMLDSQIETGTPYMLYKDAANKKSNQKNIGTIMSSNLCTEILEYSDDTQTAVCNLASIGLSKFVEPPENKLGAIEIYTKDDCNWCLMLKGLLHKNNYIYKEHVVTKENFASYKETHNHPTVPLLYSDGVKIGGYDAVNEYLRPIFNFDKLHSVTQTVTNNLNKVIDLNFYPTDKTRRSNMYHRPIGIGVQGLADVFAMMNYPFDSDASRQLNKDIFETIYHASLTKSNEIAKNRCDIMTTLHKSCGSIEGNVTNEWEFKDTSDDFYREYTIHSDNADELQRCLAEYKPTLREFNGLSQQHIGAYSSFEGSPTSNGILQFDMWDVIPSNRYDWDALKESIKQWGIRNSLLVAPMPTASTSQILGNNECFEPFTSNIYVRRTIAGEFVILNKYLMEDMDAMGLWSKDVKNMIIATNGSIQSIDGIPSALQDKYKTVWEMSMKSLIDMSSDRGAYICQSQSMNLWIQNPDYNKLTAMHFHAWSKGLKTGLYYLRTMAKASAQQFTIDPTMLRKANASQEDEECLMCGS